MFNVAPTSRKLVLTIALFIALGGCAVKPQEDLVVPPVSQQVEKLPVKQVYSLVRPTVMAAMAAGGAQPQIHLDYDKTTDGPPPAEAFERTAFPVSGTQTVLETDPANPSGPDILVTESAPAWWNPITLNANTRISVSAIEVYNNSHLYRGRILDGSARNSYVLLVVPANAGTMPTLAQIQQEDAGYLIPSGGTAIAPTTSQ